MAAVHGIPLDQYDGGPASGAVALSLSKKSQHSRVHHFHDQGWEVELRRGSDHVIARTNLALTGAALLNAAIDQTHRALDLTSLEDSDHLTTARPAEAHIILEDLAGTRVVRLQNVSDCAIGIEMEMTVIRGDGTIEPQPVRLPLAWAPAYRFHRLSQSSRDLFDAYRNMFLGLEALLDQLSPKGRQEGEKAWLLRAIAAAGARVNLAQIAAPGAADPARDLVDRIYGIRVQLFHAKTGRALIPDERVSYLAVAETYPALLSLWTETVREWLALKRGGAVITYEGFRVMMEDAYGSAGIGVTADDTAPSKEETTPSPLGLPMTKFAEPIHAAEVRPGRIGLIGRAGVSQLPAGQVIGRVLILNSSGAPLIISSITGGLSLDGADVFEAVNVLRLVNSAQPKTEFY